MTEFQRRCTKRIIAALGESGYNISFSEEPIVSSLYLVGILDAVRKLFGLRRPERVPKPTGEKYLAARVDGKAKVEICIYDLEAQVHRARQCFICERADYSSEDELIEAFVPKVVEAVLSDKFKGNSRVATLSELLLMTIVFLALMGGLSWVSVLVMSWIGSR